MQPRKKGSVWQRKVVNGNRYACKSKLCVKIVFVRQRPKTLRHRVCRDKLCVKIVFVAAPAAAAPKQSCTIS